MKKNIMAKSTVVELSLSMFTRVLVWGIFDSFKRVNYFPYTLRYFPYIKLAVQIVLDEGGFKAFPHGSKKVDNILVSHFQEIL